MNRSITTIFLFILIFAPLSFGTVETWSLTLMESLTFFISLLFLLSIYLHKDPVYQVPALVPLLCLLGYLLIQMIPLPLFLVKLISPATHQLYVETMGSIDPPGWIPLTIHPRGTLSEFFRFSAYVAFYILAVQLLTKRTFIKTTIRIVIIFAGLLAILAMVQHFTTAPGSGRKIFWFRELTQGGSPFGPYVNRNHYAGWMGMVFPIIFSMFLYYTPKGDNRSFREKWVNIITEERTNTYILLGLLAFITSLSIIMTLSRGGIISLCLVAVFFAVIIVTTKPAHGKGFLVITCISILVLFLGWLGWAPVFERFDSIHTADGGISGQRLTIWEDTFNIAKDFPATGSGFGTFEYIYPKYSHFSGDLIVRHAENDYLELLAEGGTIGALLVFWIFLVFFYRSLTAFRKRKDTFSIYLYLGTLAGIISIFFHGLLDFNLHIGANGLYLFFLMGLNVSAANTRISYRKKDTNLVPIHLPLSRVHVLSGIGILLTLIVINISGLLGEINYTSIKGVRLGKQLSAETLETVRHRALLASRFDPLEAKYRYALANIETFGGNDELAQKQYRAALRLNPSRGEYIQRLAKILSEKEQFDAAEKLYQANIDYHPSESEKYLSYAAWLLSRTRVPDALAHLKQAIALDTRNVADGLTLMVINGLSESEMQLAIPDRVEPHLQFADFLRQTGKTDMAEESYRRALQFINNEKTVKSAYFEKVYQFYLRNDRFEDAIEVLNKALEYLPSNPQLFLKVAGLYERIDNIDQAVKAYQSVLRLDPKNRHAKRRLDQMLLNQC